MVEKNAVIQNALSHLDATNLLPRIEEIVDERIAAMRCSTTERAIDACFGAQMPKIGALYDTESTLAAKSSDFYLFGVIAAELIEQRRIELGLPSSRAFRTFS